jgi:hypothetical protein
VNPDDAIRRALRPWRRHNMLWYLETSKIPFVSDMLLRTSVAAAMAYPHTAGLNLWASSA